MTITPRHSLDFIQHLRRLYNEKRSGLEEEQLWHHMLPTL